MRIKTTAQCALLALATISVPASALGVGDLAKTVLGGSSVLKKGEEKCGSSLALSRNESLELSIARAAVERILPLSELTALDTVTKAEADTAANSSTFCNETKQKKPGLMKSIKKAGKSILLKRVLGG